MSALALGAAAHAQPLSVIDPEETYGYAWSFYKIGDYASALPLAVTAATEGHPEAAKIAADIYQRGLTGKPDPDEAAKWLRAAALASEDSDALFQLGIMGRDGRGGVTGEEAVTFLRRAADLGRADARHELALLYLDGVEGVEADEPRARALLQQAATSDLAVAQRDLALMLLEGRGGERDPDQALAWLRRAAEAGDVEAAYELGVVLSDGVVAPPDDAEASRWMRQASEAGHPRATTLLGVMTLLGLGGPQSSPGAAEFFRTAAEAGDPLGRFYLALVLAKGDGVPRDLIESYRWLVLSEAGGPLANAREERDREKLKQALEASLPAEERERVRSQMGANAGLR
ncbi:MAG: sel1 repeat family protein [Caulobacterales bacterium]|nr:sel1 repeat family protein [Caulobacterales bacterium]